MNAETHDDDAHERGRSDDAPGETGTNDARSGYGTRGVPRRVVSLCPSLTELVFDLGAGDTLVGRTRYCVHPTGRVDAVEAVGGTKDPDVARIVALSPHLVLLNAEENRREDHDTRVAAGLRCHVRLPKSVEDTADMVRAIGRVLGRDAAADEIAADIEARAARVRAAATGARLVHFACLVWRQRPAPARDASSEPAASSVASRPLGQRATTSPPDATLSWMGVNGDTFIHGLLSLAGGSNVLAHRAERYPLVTAAELSAADPELVLLTSEPFPFAARHADELVAATGLPRARFVLADGELLSWHGSRTRLGIDHAADLITAARAARTETEVGECARCRHVKPLRTRGGGLIHHCRRAVDDPRFVRYPRLPMHGCVGYEEVDS